MQFVTSSPRPSIFDAIDVEEPETAPEGVSERPVEAGQRPPMFGPARRGRSVGIVAAILALYGISGWSLYRTWESSGVDASTTRAAVEEDSDTPEETEAVAPATVVPPHPSPLPRGERGPDLAPDAAVVSADLPPRPVPPSEAEPLVSDVALAALSPLPEEEDLSPAAESAPTALSPLPLEPREPEMVVAEVVPRAPEEPTTPTEPVLDEWQSAVKIYSPQPDYPADARARRLEGTVYVVANVTPAGTVERARVLRGVAPALDQAATDAVSHWRFEPARLNGEPAADTYRVAIRFALEPANESAPATAAPAATATADLELGNDDFLPPVKLYTPPPRYPPTDWIAAVEGEVVLEAAIDERGTVTSVEVLEGVSSTLDQAAIEALEKWRFRPARRDGQPVASNHVQRFRFAR